MENSTTHREALLDVARAHARQRLVIDSHLIHEIASQAVDDAIAASPDASFDDLAAHSRTRVERSIAVHFRRQRTHVRASGPVAATGGVALEYFVTGAMSENPDHVHPVWRALHDGLTPAQQKLIRLMLDGVPQAAIADGLGYANADVVKVTVTRLRMKLRNEFAARVNGN